LRLIALKLFEPTAVHAYYSETTQYQYHKYLAGGLKGIPGFEHHDDPARRLSPVEFYRLWERYERDPDAYFEQIRMLVDAESRVRRIQADQDYELQLLERQREAIDHRLALEQRRRESELAAHERELDMRLQETERRLTGETDAEIERLQAQRAEARRAHAWRWRTSATASPPSASGSTRNWRGHAPTGSSAKRANRRRWSRQRQAFDETRRAARDDERLRQLALDDQRRLRERELSQAAEDSERTQQRAARALRIEQTRALIADERKVQAQQRETLLDLRNRLARAAASLRSSRPNSCAWGALAEGQRRRETLLQRIDEAAQAMPTTKSFWPTTDQAAKTHRKALRQLERSTKNASGCRGVNRSCKQAWRAWKPNAKDSRRPSRSWKARPPASTLASNNIASASTACCWRADDPASGRRARTERGYISLIACSFFRPSTCVAKSMAMSEKASRSPQWSALSTTSDMASLITRIS
jgi:hypothetical protein